MNRKPITLWILILLAAGGAWASPTLPTRVEAVVQNWLALDWKPLGAPLGEQIREIHTVRDEAGNPVYHLVALEPTGLVVVAGDDLVEPIIAFVPGGSWDPSPQNHLNVFLEQDLPGRVSRARQGEAAALAAGKQFVPPPHQEEARSKWQALETGVLPKSMSAVSDERVPALTKSTWNQGDAGGQHCYNYYTPKNYICGCGATALAQLMRYHQHPKVGIGMQSFGIFVDSDPATWVKTRGGNGSGGPYEWAKMVLEPSSTTSEAQCKAIGALTYDAGLSVNMHYNPGNSWAILDNKFPLVSPFKYGNQMWAKHNNIPSTDRNAIVNPNLDAGLPVLLGISGTAGVHFVLADGYGYHVSTLYHHLNMGWSGGSDAWYNLPTIGASFDTNYLLYYNVYKSGTGEIVSGRVLTPEGFPITGAVVKATGGGNSYQATTNGRGIYALPRLPSSTAFTLTTSGLNTSASIAVTTGKSQNGTTTTGNRWNKNLTLSPTNRKINAVWVHGMKVIPQSPELLTETRKVAWGSFFRGQENSDVWFHIPIPTPVLKEDRRTVVTNVYVYFQTTGDAKITAVHVWDGSKKIRAFDGLALSGNHAVWDRWNKFALWETMSTGIELAVLVEFGSASGGVNPFVYFSAAGADFYRWW